MDNNRILILIGLLMNTAEWECSCAILRLFIYVYIYLTMVGAVGTTSGAYIQKRCWGTVCYVVTFRDICDSHAVRFDDHHAQHSQQACPHVAAEKGPQAHQLHHLHPQHHQGEEEAEGSERERERWIR